MKKNIVKVILSFSFFVIGYVFSIIIVMHNFSGYSSGERLKNENKKIEVWPFVISVNYNEKNPYGDDDIPYVKVIRMYCFKWEIYTHFHVRLIRAEKCSDPIDAFLYLEK